MLHEQVRQARIDRGLSQVKLAQLAKVPRSQLRKFENGEGITMTTFLKIISQLPNLEHLTLGLTELHLQNVDLEALRATLTQLITSAAGVLAVLQTARPRTDPETDTAVGAVLHHPTVTERERAEELNAIAVALARGGGAGASAGERTGGRGTGDDS
jgi:transcriptional regulator with XRE-family HTH domain